MLFRSIYGGDANDVIYANGGNNSYFGGNATIDTNGNITGSTASGDDRVNYSLATSAINADLSVTANTTTYNVTANGFGGQDKLYSITRITGSNFDDVIKGSSGWNRLDGENGDDWIKATNGGDHIYGGNHTITAGTQGSTAAIAGGGDWLSFQDIASSVTARIDQGSITGSLGTTTIFQIENLFGTSTGDDLRGDSNNNTLHGNGGNDAIFGTAGSNFLIGGSGNDTLYTGTGVDKYDGGDATIITASATTHYAGSTNHGINTISFYS